MDVHSVLLTAENKQHYVLQVPSEFSGTLKYHVFQVLNKNGCIRV